ncbi:MAG: A/G-specific adenine glycosylase [Bacillota bacterium]|nr:A/G-specific adenine glycosylase [Bacillota bacterium]
MLICHKLLNYYDVERRILPWREDPTPYHVWISEIMLQQTRVEAGIRYYERFLERFPDIRSLAEAPIDEVLKLWEGLGYYSRARNLHRAAQIVMSDHGGVLPASKPDLLALPGIGGYTAGAILSIAYGQKELTIDGNFYRVGSRLIAYEGSIDRAEGKRAIEGFWSEQLPAERPGDFNQAVMDLGATICLPNGAPRCDRCPVREDCKAFALGEPERFPLRSPKKKRPVEIRRVLILRDDCGRFLLRRRPKSGLLAGMWEFPMELVRRLEGDGVDPGAAMSVAEAEDILQPLGTPDVTHVFSHVEWHLYLGAESAPLYLSEDESLRYFSEAEVEELALASVFRRIWERVREK